MTTDATAIASTSVTTGITGSRWRASITPWGGIEPWDGDGTALDWYVAADDRWHVPAREAAVRQVRLDGTPVTETRVRVPDGDVVQRVFSVADSGGLTVIEVENESTMAVAVAVSRRDVLTERPIADVPIEGIELPDGAFVMPLGHKATLRFAIAHGGPRSGPLASGLPTARQVANGWLTMTERASRFVLPDGERGAGLAERVTALRCEVALGQIPNAVDDPVGFAIALGELVRMGERPDPWLPELVDAVELLGPDPSWEAAAALAAADRVLASADEDRARRDLARITAGRSVTRRPGDPPDGIAAVPWLESVFAVDGALLPGGLPASWYGQSIEVYGIPTSAAGAVSFALRWHGERPAVLWEQVGDAVTLAAPAMAPDWSTSDTKGEALWPVPPDGDTIAVASDPADPAGPAGPVSFA